MALILSLETSTHVCSTAIHDEGQLVTSQLHQVEKSHSSLLPTIVLEICKEAGLSISDLAGIAVSEGPGSYTGLRIGISSAKGFAYSLKVPLIGIPTLDIMLEAVRNIHTGEFMLCAMMDARRMEVYTKMEDQDGQVIWDTQPKILDEYSFSEFENTIYVFGDGMPKFREVSLNRNLEFIDDVLPDASKMGRLAKERFELRNFEDVAYFEPNYLKKWRTTTPKNKLS